jgi:4-oxalocrotonate tautomerase
MPYISIELSKKITEEQRLQLFSKTTELMNVILHKRKEVTLVQVKESTSSQWSVDSRPLSLSGKPCAYVNIKITRGTNSPGEKSDMIGNFMNMLKEVIGSTEEASYVVIDEVPADSWGYDGITQKHRSEIS